MNSEKIMHVRHSFNAGDIIYSLWSVREFCEKNDYKAVYYQWLNRPTYHKEGHPTQDKHGNIVTFNQYMFDLLYPLMVKFPFIEDFLPWQGEKSVSLDRIREISSPLPYGDIRKWYGYAYPDFQCDISKKLIDFTIEGDFREYRDVIVVNRTARYRNPQINYAFLQRLKPRVVFVGSLDEYNEFQMLVPKAEYVYVKDFLELAGIIQNSMMFIGNQSFCFSLAEAMHATRVLEISMEYPNVTVVGPDGYDFVDNQSFETIVNSLLLFND